MQILTFILSILAFVLAGAALALTVRERKSSRTLASATERRFKGMAEANKKSRTALLQYVDEADKKAAVAAEKLVKEANARIDKANQAIRAVNVKAEAAKKMAEENKDHIEDLEQGVVPDFEAAKEAVNAVNSFNNGVTGILGFDPLEALKQSKQEAK